MATTHAIDATIDGVGDAADALLLVPRAFVRRRLEVLNDSDLSFGMLAFLELSMEAVYEAVFSLPALRQVEA